MAKKNIGQAKKACAGKKGKAMGACMSRQMKGKKSVKKPKRPAKRKSYKKKR